MLQWPIGVVHGLLSNDSQQWLLLDAHASLHTPCTWLYPQGLHLRQPLPEHWCRHLSALAVSPMQKAWVCSFCVALNSLLRVILVCAAVYQLGCQTDYEKIDKIFSLLLCSLWLIKDCCFQCWECQCCFIACPKRTCGVLFSHCPVMLWGSLGPLKLH